MKRIKFNTTWEEDEEERRTFFAGLSYSERLYHLIRASKKINFHKPPLQRRDLMLADFKLPNSPYKW